MGRKVQQSLFEIIKNHRANPTVNAKKKLVYLRPPCPDAFARFMGSNDGGIFLSRLIYWSERPKRRDGYFYKSMSDWMSELQIGEKKILKFRQKLEDANILEMKLIKAHGKPTTHYKLNKQMLVGAFEKFLDTEYEFPEYAGAHAVDVELGESEVYEAEVLDPAPDENFEEEILDAETIEEHPLRWLRDLVPTDVSDFHKQSEERAIGALYEKWKGNEFTVEDFFFIAEKCSEQFRRAPKPSDIWRNLHWLNAYRHSGKLDLVKLQDGR